MKKRTIMALVVALGFPVTAVAYLPPAWFIVKKMLERVPHKDSFIARGTARLAGRDGAATRVVLFQAPDKVRVETTSDGKTRVDVWDGARRLVKSESGAVDEASGPEIPLGVVFGSIDPLAALKARGGDAKVSMTLDRGRATYVIGSREKGKAQLWIDRDTFTPSRVVVPIGSAAEGSGATGSSVELRFSDYDLSLTAGKFPRLLETLVDGARVDSFSVESFEAGVAVPAKAFERDGLASTIK
ncbi:MAG: hypothetical protein HYY84_11750 [Deltaproteobacteria bacterium]|nr:hypothetical protein [Deltaproteobacteria bacterium]